MVRKQEISKPPPPKKPLTPFFLYRGQIYQNVKEKNPDAHITELTKIIGQMWGKVDKETKNRLEAIYDKNKTQYQEEKAVYERKYGKIQRKKRRVAKSYV